MAIIGAGAAGHSVASQLAKSKRFEPQDILLIDKQAEHYYQPAFTMVGGGVIGNEQQARKKESTYVKRSQKDLLYTGVNLKEEKVVKVDAGSNTVETENGS